MAAMARNTVLLLVLVAVVIQLCSVVPPAAAAGRVLADDKPCPDGGIGGKRNNDKINGGGQLNCGGTNGVNGEAHEENNQQKVSVGAAGRRIGN
ncbi:hypothetical protein ACP70R_005748 [Stipagrostis hirtigluma subsp. patula]